MPATVCGQVRQFMCLFVCLLCCCLMQTHVYWLTCCSQVRTSGETAPPGSLAVSLSLGALLRLSPGAFLFHDFQLVPVGSLVRQCRLYPKHTVTVSVQLDDCRPAVVPPGGQERSACDLTVVCALLFKKIKSPLSTYIKKKHNTKEISVVFILL